MCFEKVQTGFALWAGDRSFQKSFESFRFLKIRVGNSRFDPLEACLLFSVLKRPQKEVVASRRRKGLRWWMGMDNARWHKKKTNL